MKKKISIISAIIFLMFISTLPAFANKASVKIDSPDSIKAGETITIKVTVSHKGNNRFHHTNWVYIKVGDKEIAKWEFTGSSLPENEVFTKEVSYKVENPITIKAEASCNIHGSAGVSEKAVNAN